MKTNLSNFLRTNQVSPIQPLSRYCLAQYHVYFVRISEESDLSLNLKVLCFFSQQNPCSNNPCANSGTCQAGFTSKGFRCLCRPRFTGENCQFKGKNGNALSPTVNVVKVIKLFGQKMTPHMNHQKSLYQIVSVEAKAREGN